MLKEWCCKCKACRLHGSSGVDQISSFDTKHNCVGVNTREVEMNRELDMTFKDSFLVK